MAIACAIVLAAIAGLAHGASMAIDAGSDHNIALRADGGVRSWGSDNSGQLGIDRKVSSALPSQVVTLDGVTALASGLNFSVALRQDGTVWAWGDNRAGQLGDGTTTNIATPVRALGLAGVSAISAAGTRSMALRTDGTVWAWGSGFVGDGTTVSREKPVQVSGIASVRAIASGQFHSLAVRSDGSVWSWGYNGDGALGDGTTNNRLTPGPVAFPSPMLAVAGGGHHSLALASDGSVWAWGLNGFGQLGDGTTTNRLLPTRVAGLAAVTAISAGGNFSLALRSDGTVWQWGDGQATPVQVSSLSSIAAISAGDFHSAALRSDGSVWMWGSNYLGQLGDGTTFYRAAPVQVINLAPAAAVSAGAYHTVVALRGAGNVLAFGDNSAGELGDAGTVARSTPTAMRSLAPAIAISAGADHSLMVTADGKAWGVGYNAMGQLGDGTNVVSRTTPVEVRDLASVSSVAAGAFFSLALTADRRVWSWGTNTSGELGLGNTLYHSAPTRIDSLTDIVKIAAGSHALAVQADGTLWGWGYNLGQLGALANGPVTAPVRIAGLSNIVAAAAGHGFTLALKSDGTVWALGLNVHGQLGDGTTVSRSTPAQVPGLSQVIAIAAGGAHSVALKSDGTVWTWGHNGSGALGDGTTTFRSVPVQVKDLGNVTAISAGGRGPNYIGGITGHTLALKADGTVWGWGNSGFGQVGDGTLASRTRPVLVVREDGGGSIAANDWFLDLNPALPKQVPADKVPPFLAVTSGGDSYIAARIQYRAQDVGTSGSVYVFALAPTSAVKESNKDVAVQCVLAQLTSSGELKAVSTSNLQAYVTGVLSGQGQAVAVLNGVPTATIGGATFFVGYGSTPSAMLANGTNRSVATVPGTTQCQPQPPQTGWWWNPSEAGRGYSIEARGNHLFFASYLYDVSGRATWLVAAGSTSLEGSLFNANLESYSQGQTLAGSYKGPTGVVGQPITLAFNDATHGTLIWPGGTIPIERFNIVPNGLALASQSNQPEAGWWWNPDESGRGFFLEWQGGQLFMAGYMYDDAGNPIWYLSGNSTPSANLQSYANTWQLYGNGQTLTGGYKAPTQVNANVAPVTIQFQGAENAIMTLPGGRTTAIRRFRF